MSLRNRFAAGKERLLSGKFNRKHAPAKTRQWLVEPLENRRLLSTVTWNTDNNGLWTTGSNWDTGTPPAPGDDVVINRPGFNVTVTFPGGALPLNNLTNHEVLVLASGTNATWTSGTWSGSGVIRIASGANLAISGASDKLLKDGIDLENNGDITWTGTGNINGAVGATINNESGGNFDCQTDADIVFTTGQGTGIFNNKANATFIKSAGSGTTIIGGQQGFTLNNDGTVEVASGTLGLGDDENEGISKGAFLVDAGTTLDFMRGQQLLTLDRSTTPNTIPEISGNGTVIFSGGTVTMFGTYDVHQTIIDGGTILFDQNMTEPTGSPQLDTLPVTDSGITDILTFSSGTLGGNGAGLTMDNLERPGLFVFDTFTWTGGNMSGQGRVDVLGTGTISGSGDRRIEGSYILDISGHVDWTDDNVIRLAGGSGVWIHDFGTLLASNDSSILADDNGFVNIEGSLTKDNSTGTTTIGVNIHVLNDVDIFADPTPPAKPPNSKIDLETGTLSILGSLDNNDVILVRSGAVLDLPSGNPNNAGSILGAGTVHFGACTYTDTGLLDVGNTVFDGGTYNFNNAAVGASVIDDADFLSGTLGGTGAVKVVGTFAWTAGTLAGSGSMLIDTNGTLEIEGGNRAISGGYQIENRGILQWNGPAGSILSPGGYTQTSTGALNLGIDSASTADSMTVNGTVNLAGTLSLSLNYVPGPTDSIVLINNDGSDPIVGTFAGRAEGSTLVLNGVTFVLSYQGGSGNDVAIAVQSNPAISVDDVSVNEGNTGTTAFLFTVTLASASLQTVTVDYATADGTATLANSDYASASGTLTFPAGVTTQTFTVFANGDTALETDETFLVNLSNPVNGTLGDAQGVGTILDDDNPSIVRLSSASYTVAENAGSATITVSRNGALASLTVDYATSDGTATAPADYTVTSGSVTFAPGELVKTFSIPIVDDALNEADETVNITLSNVNGGVLGVHSAVLTITNDDPQPTISITDASGSEDPVAPSVTPTPLTFTVSLSAVSGQTVTVNFASADGTAASGSDYDANSGTLTFAPGETSKTITINPIDDAIGEGDENFFINLSGASNATIADAQAVGTLVHDTGTFSFSAAAYSITEKGGNVTITVNRTNGADGAADVDFTTSDGTAIAGTDYTTASGTLHFTAGQTSASFVLDVSDNRTFNADKTVILTLSNPTNNASIGSTGSSVVTIIDDDPHNGIIAVASRSHSGVIIRGFAADTHFQTISFSAYTRREKGDVRIAMADVTGDGVPDFITALSKGSEVRVFDGVTGAKLSTAIGDFSAFEAGVKGVFIAGGDVNGDGFADVIVTSGGSSRVRVFDGVTGALASEFTGLPGSFKDGVSVASGDVNGDGNDDIIVGGGKKSTEVRVFNGTDNSLLADFSAFNASEKVKNGVFVATGDINNDGLADIVASSRKGGRSLARIFNGNDSSVIASFSVFGSHFTGSTAITTANVTGDGSDKVVGIRFNSKTERVRIFDQPMENDFLSFGVLSDGTGTPFVAGS